MLGRACHRPELVLQMCRVAFAGHSLIVSAILCHELGELASSFHDLCIGRATCSALATSAVGVRARGREGLQRRTLNTPR
eukprot:366546-Chlamydomonas_euryale.AAC.13